MVGRKAKDTIWSCEHEDQTCYIRLPQGKSATGVLSLWHLDVLEAPNPNHGLLPITTPYATVTFDKLLQVFLAVYGNTLDAKGLMPSRENVRGIFLNYTDKNGQRVATAMYSSSDSIKNSHVFRSTYLEENPLPCTCGCNQSHHGPSAILILDSNSLVQRKKDASEESTMTYSMLYQDDPMVKIKAFPTSVFVPLIVQQEINSLSATTALLKVNAALAQETKEKEKALKDLQEKEVTMNDMNDAIEEAMKLEDEATDKYNKLVKKIDKLEMQNAKKIDKLAVKNAKKVAALETRNKDLKAEIKADVRDHAYEKKGQEATGERYRRREEENEKLKTKNKTLEENNKSLRDDVRTLRTEITTSRSDLTIARQGYERELNGLRLEVRNLKMQAGKEVEKSQIRTAAYNDLMLRIRRVALNDTIATKERAIINGRLNNARAHFNNQDHYRVLQDIDQLLQQMDKFPTPPTIQEFEMRMNGILSNSAYTVPVKVVARPNVSAGVMLNGQLPRPPNSVSANPFSQGVQPNPERDAKKRKIDETDK